MLAIEIRSAPASSAAHRHRPSSHRNLSFAGDQCLDSRGPTLNEDNVNVESMFLKEPGFFGQPISRHIGRQRTVRSLELEELGRCGWNEKLE